VRLQARKTRQTRAREDRGLARDSSRPIWRSQRF